MFHHKWFFQGKVIKIINDQAVIIWVDLGFETWKKVLVQFNRIRSKSNPGPGTGISPAVKFMEQNLKGKQIYCRIFKKDYNGIPKYFAEIYTNMGEIPLRLIDINKSISNSHRIDGLINFNDTMVSQGFSIYIQFKKDPGHAKLPLYNRSPRKNIELRNDSESSLSEKPKSDSSWGGLPPQGQ